MLITSAWYGTNVFSYLFSYRGPNAKNEEKFHKILTNYERTTCRDRRRQRIVLSIRTHESEIIKNKTLTQ